MFHFSYIRKDIRFFVRSPAGRYALQFAPPATDDDVQPRIQFVPSVIEQESRNQTGQYIDEIMCLYIDSRQCQANTDGQEVPE